MEQTQLQQTLGNLFSDAVFGQNTQFVEITVPANSLLKTLKLLKEYPETQFDFLSNLTGVDTREEFRVVYHLRSTKLNHAMVVKVNTNERVHPEFESAASIWPAANPFEREAFDLLGIRFKNHPDLRRLFLEDDFQGYPLRKDFVDAINIVEK